MNKKQMTSRQKRYAAKKNSFMIRLIISVVALIECLLLLSFTTYSWIESSSSLIISSGKNGVLSMSVANNLNYQVLVSLDAAGNVNLMDNAYNEETDDGGYYRSVRNFSYAKTNSPDGKTFYFKKTNGDSSNPYRPGDTADYNTSYTYFDFSLKNTTKTTKGFYFNTASIFEINDKITDFTTDEQRILDAMRISVQKDNNNPDIYSLNGHKSYPVNSTTGALLNSDGITTRNITSGYSQDGHQYSYIFTGTQYDSPVFESTVADNEDVENKISLRIWFDETDEYYRSLSGSDKTAFDALLAAAKIKLNFSFINDNVDYDKIYFDDFAFSHKSESLGRFVTEEDASYRMYLHVYNAKHGKYVNYPMNKVVNNDNDAVRWMTTVPIPYVVEERNSSGSLVSGHDYLTNTSNSCYSGAYFFCGTAVSDTAEPTYIAYKWSMPGAMSITNAPSNSSNQYVISNDKKYFRNLGVVRSSSSQENQIPGFIQYSSDSSGVMQLTYLRDRATALTSGGYNVSNAATNVLNFQYITASIHNVDSQSSGTVTFDASDIANNDKIYYADVPKNAYVMFHVDNYTYQTSQTGWQAQDGVCIYPTGPEKEGDKNYLVAVHNVDLPELNDPTGRYVRVYFYDSFNWVTSNTTLYAHSWAGDWAVTGADPVGASIINMPLTYEVTNTTIRSDGIYLNTSAFESAATSTVAMYYDRDINLFKAYVPTAWLTNGFYVHYNELDAYYDVSSDKLRWSTGAASAYNGSEYLYTVLGYNNANTLANITAGNGIGTWSDVREMSFDTELISSRIASGFCYKIWLDDGSYPMIPADNLCLTFKAYVPVEGLATQSSTPVIKFERYPAYNNGTPSGVWTPSEDITATELTYYAVDASGEANTNQGWFHVAVLTDATFENLIYDTIVTDPEEDALLQYSYSIEEGATFNNIPVNTDTRHWVVPMMSGTTIYDTVYFKWVPYTNTEFIYTHSISDGIYCTVVEASGTPVIEPTEPPESSDPEP